MPDTFLEPADWPLAGRVLPLIGVALARLELDTRIARVTIILDELTADERAWLQLSGTQPHRCLSIWLHPDQLLCERAMPGTAGTGRADWEQGCVPDALPALSNDDFSLLNTQRALYQQLLLVRDLIDGRLRPDLLPPKVSEAFQEAWLVTIDGRLQRAGLPHLSAARRRLRFLHVFSSGAVLTPSHWMIFNQLWEGELLDQDSLMARFHLLPALRNGLPR